MRAGDMALSAGGNLAGWLIRTGDHSRYNHVRLILNEQGDVAEAVGGGFVYGKVRPGDVICSPLGMTDEQREQIPDVVASLIGRPYGYIDVVALGLAQIGFFKKLVARRVKNPRRLFCSQAVDHAWLLAGYHAFNDKRMSQNVTPGDLADLALREDWESYAYAG